MFALPPLPYAYDALEPYIDAKTMEIHYTKHHQAYTDKLNAAIENTPLSEQSIEEILANISRQSTAIRNNGGGYFNHNFFWESLTSEASSPSGVLADALVETFGSIELFKEKFETAASGQFGSGWGWLVVSEAGLEIGATPNQDNPLMDVSPLRGTPLLGVDVWEHAYYLHYQNRRPEYLSAIWNVVNWKKIEERYATYSS